MPEPAATDGGHRPWSLKRPNPATSRSVLGRAYLALGGALAAAGDATEATVALGDAVRHLDWSVGAGHPDALRARALLAALAPS